MKPILVQPQDFKKSGIEVIKTQSTGMKRNTVTTLDEINVGDRFFRVGDKKKEVWQKITVVGSNLKHAKRDSDKYPVVFKNNTQIIFLRHAN